MTHDLRFALRAIRTSPGFTTVVVATLALGIGANTAVFSFTSAILLRPLPFYDSDRLVVFQQAAGRTGYISPVGIGLSADDYTDVRANSQSLVDVATYTLHAATLSDGEAPDHINVAVLTDNFFTVLGSKAALGRVFTPEDRTAGAGRLAVMNHAYWMNRYSGDRSVIGRPIALNGIAFTLVGVMPPDYEFPLEARLYVNPTGARPEGPIGWRGDETDRGPYLRTLIGRLRSGVSIEAAEAELRQVIDNLPNPGNMRRPVHLVTMRHQIVGNVRPMLAIVFGGALIVLFVACLNIANLFLSRASTRQHEFGIRLAIGASRWQIVRPLLVESTLLSLAGGLLGLLVAGLSLELLVGLAPASIPRLTEVTIDRGVFAFAFALSVFTGIACGLGPALTSAALNLSRWLNDAGRGGSGGRGVARLRATLVAIEVAMSFALLVAAGLLVRSFQRVLAVDWDITANNVVTMRIGFTDPHYQTPGTRIDVGRSLLERLENVPGMESVGLSFDRIGFPWITLPFSPEGYEPAKREDRPRAWFHPVSPGYFRTLGIPLFQGRDFGATDNDDAPAAIIDTTVARRFFPEGDAVGRHLRLSFEKRPLPIVGVVGAVRSGGPEAPPGMDVYVPVAYWDPPDVFLSVRTRLAPASAVAAVRAELDRLAPMTPIADVATMGQVVDRASHGRRFPLVLIGTFAALALALATVGVYAVAAHATAQRTREVGIRLAVGAQAYHVLRYLMRRGLTPVIVGLAIGLAASVGAALMVRQFLFDVGPLDLATLAGIPPFLVAIALLACWLPARRAARVDPAITLRAE